MRHPDGNAITIELKRYLNELTRCFSCAYEVQILGDISCIRNEVETNSGSKNIEDDVPTRYYYWSIPTTTIKKIFQPVYSKLYFSERIHLAFLLEYLRSL